ncbi:sugar kinase [Acrocarpospora pleiomorpha]|uniref:Sugar kinase n=1 Tax=Acrocarpospora pleiomorpha TaxID=90975 RepID=A0A5M3XEN6_9ACTN|nr:ROK family transcriptional regulator [Acrocarpospora pleiomorpha]GES19734.1 sugar kinase [Acrocarpospora pleiomorpha]
MQRGHVPKNPLYEDSGRKGQVLRLLQEDPGLTRTEVARRLGLSATTMTRVVGQLLEEGCVTETRKVSRIGTGRPGTELAIEPMAYYVIGVHVGVGTVRLGVVDLVGTIRKSVGFEFDPDLDADAVLNMIAGAVPALLAGADLDRARLLGVGVAVPGPVDGDHRKLLLPINLAWRDVPIADRLESVLRVPVIVEHNVRSMALAEARFGAGQGVNSVAFIYVRMGVGAGLVVQGQAFQGGMHGAIELGHSRVVEGGEKCICGGVGCLETVLSERALRHALAALGRPTDPRNPLESLLEIAAADPAAAAQTELITKHLATGLSFLVNMLNPELILLGGFLGAAPDTFLERLTEATREAVFPVIRDSVHLQRSCLGLDAGVNGGAAIALDQLFYS